MRPLLKRFGLRAIYGLDFETYWAQDYTLSKMAMTEYINDPRFEAQIVSVRANTWAKPRVMEMPAFRRWAMTIDWANSGLLAHNTAFDGYIAWRHFGIKPKMYFDTLSMLRPVMPVTVGGSLKAGCAAFKRESKQHQAALHETKGKRWAEFTKAERADLKVYAGDDVDDCWFLFDKLLPFIPTDELRLIDITMKMYCQPLLLLDKPLLEQLAATTLERKANLLAQYGGDRTQFMSNELFADMLRARNVEPPMKISKTTGEPTYAFAKNDTDFKKLLQHPDEDVATLIEARIGVKSTIVETRAQRMANRADYGPQPIYLNYWGAGTGRWSGGDSANWQNMSRGSDMRKAIFAPKGHTLVIADLAQIEARLNAWFAGQADIVEAFARGEDVYCIAASRIYGRTITKDDKLERFVGKVAVLALGYQAGWSRFAEMLRLGAFGPPLAITDMEAQAAHTAWRRANQYIVANWKATENLVKAAFIGKCSNEHNCVIYEGVGKNGFMHLPGGMALRYDDITFDEEGKLSYIQKFRRNKVKPPTILRGKLYGGLLVENRTQALARRVVAEHMLALQDAMPYWRQVLTTHDEIVGVVPNRYANRALKLANEVMSTAPVWAPDLPLAVDAHISERYDK